MREKHEFVFYAPKEVVIENLLEGAAKTNYYYERNPLRGWVDSKRNRIHFCHHPTMAYRNSFRPIFSAEISEEDGKTFLKGEWGLTRGIKVFSVLWFAHLIFMAIVPLFMEGTGNFPLLYAYLTEFALLYVLIYTVGIRIEKKNMGKVIEYIKAKEQYVNTK